LAPRDQSGKETKKKWLHVTHMKCWTDGIVVRQLL